MNRALGALGRGDLPSGWDDYEASCGPGARGRRRHLDIPQWDGSPLDGKRVLVYREQGLGDELIFGSCYPDLAARAAHLVLECRRRLVPLFSRSFPDATVLATDDPSPLPPVDVAVAAGSVPCYLRRSVDDFPVRPAYLTVEPLRRTRWQQWLSRLPAPRVGVSWRSGLVAPSRRGAYPPLDDWGPLFGTGATFVCLQHDDSASDREQFARLLGIDMVVPPDLDLRDDIDGVAALCAALDAVVTVDNAVAAIAGAVGAATHVLVPANMATALGTDGWPWFPSIGMFPRGPGETWEAPMRELAAAVAQPPLSARERAHPTRPA